MRERRPVAPGRGDDFTVRDMRQIAETQAATTGLLTRLLAAVAGVSLLVGGIGIMNIMLVFRNGANPRNRNPAGDRSAGAAGAGAIPCRSHHAFHFRWRRWVSFWGLALAWIATQALGVPFDVDGLIIAIAFMFSALVGIVFGYFPARRAAQLDPIEALRRE